MSGREAPVHDADPGLHWTDEGWAALSKYGCLPGAGGDVSRYVLVDTNTTLQAEPIATDWIDVPPRRYMLMAWCGDHWERVTEGELPTKEARCIPMK